MVTPCREVRGSTTLMLGCPTPPTGITAVAHSLLRQIGLRLKSAYHASAARTIKRRLALPPCLIGVYRGSFQAVEFQGESQVFRNT